MSGISGRLLRGGVWVTLSRIFVNGLATLSTLILAWYLTPGDFGLVAVAVAVIMIITSATDFSLSAVLVRLENPDQTHLDAAWTLNAARGVALCLLVTALSWPLARMLGDPRLMPVLIAFSFSLLISGFVNPRLSMAQRALEFWQNFTVTTGQKLAGFVVAVSVAMIFKTYWALVFGSIATQLVNVILSYVVMPFRPRILFRYVREFLSFSGWLTAAQVVNTLNWRFDQVLAGKVLGSTPLGYYTMASNLAFMPTQEATAPLMQTIYPAFSSIRSNRERLVAAYQRCQGLISAATYPAGIGLAVIADPLVRLALGERWTPIIPIIQVLAPAFALQTLGSLAQPLGMAHGESRQLFVRDLQIFAVRVPMLIAGALLGGLPGLVVARVLSGFASVPLNLLLVRQFIGLSLRSQMAVNSRPLIASLIMAAAVFLASNLFHATTPLALVAEITALVAIGGAVYAASTGLMWIWAKRPEGPEAEVLRIVQNFLKSRQGGAHPAA